MIDDTTDWRTSDVTAREVMWDASTAAIARLLRTAADFHDVTEEIGRVREDTSRVDPTDRVAVDARIRELSVRDSRNR